MTRILWREATWPRIRRQRAIAIAAVGASVVFMVGSVVTLISYVASAQVPVAVHVQVPTPTPVAVAPREPAVAPAVEPVVVVEAIALETEPTVEDVVPVPVGPRDLAFVVEAGGESYLELVAVTGEWADDGEFEDGADDPAAIPAPKHARFQLHDEDGVIAVIGDVRPEDVPEGYRRWLGRDVMVDGACRAQVTGFAVVSRLTGDPGYYGGDGDQWTPRVAYEAGHAMLSARLHGCSGSVARDASLSPLAIAVPAVDAAAVKAARRDLLGSDRAADAQRAWREGEMTGNWREAATVDAHVVRHPVTGRSWVVVQARSDVGCGGVDINLLGVYRVEQPGVVTRVRLTQVEDVGALVQLLDSDGDGELELIVTDWLGLDRIFVDDGGAVVRRSSVPFYGCPC